MVILRRRGIKSGWKYLTVALAAFLAGSLMVGVVSSEGPIKTVCVADDGNSTRMLAVDGDGRVGINNFPVTRSVTGTVDISNLPFDGEGRILIALSSPATGELLLPADEVVLAPLEEFWTLSNAH